MSYENHLSPRTLHSYREHLAMPVTVYDELDTPLLVDADLSLFFTGNDSYVKCIFVHDGRRMVFDANVGESGKYVSLERWLWESPHMEEVKGKWEVVQQKAGEDYRIVNLLKRVKSKDEKAA